MNAPSVPVQAPERATPTTTHAPPPRGLDARLQAVGTLMDERLTLAALAVAVNTALSVPDAGDVDLADIVRTPDAVPPYRRPVDLYPTPAAALLQRARARLERDGWTTGALVGVDGARCLYGAIKAEASTDHAERDALDVLLDVIRRQWPDAESVPATNDHELRDAESAVQLLDAAAYTAHCRGL